jgi:hypothetical protein
MLIAQACAGYPEEAKALIQVEKQGIAQEIVTAPDEPSLEKMAESWVQRLVDQGKLNDPDARWASKAPLRGKDWRLQAFQKLGTAVKI